MPSQEPGALERFGLRPADVERWVWLREPDGRLLRGPAAVARALEEMGGGWVLAARVARLPGSGLAYRAVERLRGRLSHLWADPPPY